MSKNILGFENKPIAVNARELMVLINQVASKMHQLYKYNLGVRLCNRVTVLTTDIYTGLDEMGPTDKKLELVKNVYQDILNLLPVVRVAKDLNLMSGEIFEEIIVKIKSIKTQCENWRHYIEKQQDKNAEKDSK